MNDHSTLPPAVTRGVFACIILNDCVLLSEYRDRTHWGLPGGGVRKGENDEEALRREVFDETGLTVQVEYAIGPVHCAKQDDAQLYLCSITGGVLQATEESWKHQWTSLENLKQLPVLPSRRMRRMILDCFSLASPPLSFQPISPEIATMISTSATPSVQSTDSLLFRRESSTKTIFWKRLPDNTLPLA